MTAEHRLRDSDRDFVVGTFVIDPAGCGCTDCIVGESTPLDRVRGEDLLAAFATGKVTVLDRTGDRRNARYQVKPQRS